MTILKRFIVVLLLPVMFALAFDVSAEITQTMTLNPSWQPPATREDGAIFTEEEVGGYNIFYGTADAGYTNAITVPPADREAFISGLPVDSYCIRMSAFDTQGRESKFSEERCTNVPSFPSDFVLRVITETLVDGHPITPQ